MRDHKIDVLRFIGLAMIIFAHVNPPDFLMNLRNFDVPLMVLVSGMSFGLSYKSSIPYNSYIWKRAKRLIFPVWIFLTIFFCIELILTPNSPDLQTGSIFASYALIGGIGYVWIIRVFLLVALISPLMFKYHQSIASNKRYLCSLALLLLISEVIRYYALSYSDEKAGKYVTSVVNYIIPYSLIFAIGLRLPSLNLSEIKSIACVNLALFILTALGLYIIYGQFIPTQNFKFPPSIYYLSYALVVSCIIWINSERIYYFVESMRIKAALYYIAQNSIWIYLWHIPFIRFIHTHYFLKYLLVFIGATTLTYIQTSIIHYILMPRMPDEQSKKNLKAIFTG